MAKNTLNDLSDLLFEQMERLRDSERDANSEEKNLSLDEEIARSKAMGLLATQVVNAAKEQVNFLKTADRLGLKVPENALNIKLLGSNE